MPFEDGFIEKRLGAFPSPWMDTHYRVPLATIEAIEQTPEEFTDLLQYLNLPLNDQGNVGSCVGHCGDTVMSLLHNKDEVYDSLSAGWLYSRSRYWANIFNPLIEGSTNLGLMKALNKEGATTEECAPTDTVKPFTMYACGEAHEIAREYMISSYHFVNRNPSDMKAAMYGLIIGFPEKTPLVTAYPVYESFKDAYDGGVVPIPKPGEQLLGGHSSAVVGWKKISGEVYWINANSWGDDVGDNGFFYLPMDYPFYDVELIRTGMPPEPEPKKSLMCQLISGLMNFFNCNGGE